MVWAWLAMAWLVLIWTWDSSYLTLTIDDSFYYLQTARNLAAGYGSTFDQLNPTNGYHPLWLLLLTAMQMFLPTSTQLAMRMILTCQVLLIAGAGWFLCRCLSRITHQTSENAAYVMILLFSCFYVTKVLVNGLESALLFGGMVFALWLWQQTEQRSSALVSRRWWHGAGLGFVAGLVVLTRLDAMAFALTLLFMPWLWPNPTPQNTPRVSVKTVGPMILGLGVCVGMVGLYLGWNLWNYGHFLPVSAAIKAQYRPVLGWPMRWLLSSVLLGCLVIPWWFAHTFSQPKGSVQGGDPQSFHIPVFSPNVVSVLRWIYPVWVYALAVSGYQILVLGQIWPPLWYLVPHLLVWMVFLVVVVRWLGTKRTERWWSPLLWTVALVTMVVSVGTWIYRLHPDSYRIYVARQEAGRWLRKHHPNQTVAGWDCGIGAAHYQGRWINLDGLINSWTYKTKYLDQHRTQEFVERVHRVDWLVQHIPVHVLPGLRRWRGVDLSGWHVEKATYVSGRLMRHPWRRVTWVLLILSRTPTSQPFLQWRNGTNPTLIQDKEIDPGCLPSLGKRRRQHSL